MAASQVSVLKMRTLLFGVILGLLAVVHSTPLNTVTQIPSKAEDEVIREAATEGFLIENFLLPKTYTTVQVSEQPTSESGMIEGSGEEPSDQSTTSVTLQFGTTTVSPALSSASTALPSYTDDSSSGSFTTQMPDLGSTSAPNKAQSSVTPDHILASQTTDQGSGEGSGYGVSTTTTSSSMTSSSNSETSAPSSSTAVFGISKGSSVGVGSGRDPSEEPTSIRNKKLFSIVYEKNRQDITPAASIGGSTPGWMIIVGFIVGLASLVMLFVAIATRDKWNGPSQVSKLVAQTNNVNQQKEVEMETFLPKDNPKENGHTAEYTVIPLEELPENHSSH
ncbi:mucin-21 [Anoplopoma fimbria]|uniref:mucin-21 n=1 Tax=Anoplopoma fimbria TaxID=229290 RepID=UPI0023EB50ED|nr:mucin-21 [Anoplopoma fimbria]